MHGKALSCACSLLLAFALAPALALFLLHSYKKHNEHTDEYNYYDWYDGFKEAAPICTSMRPMAGKRWRNYCHSFSTDVP
ncbi:MAG: hypothetical protein V3T62_10590, partial [Alphaproteobacteria bacterium]